MALGAIAVTCALFATLSPSPHARTDVAGVVVVLLTGLAARAVYRTWPVPIGRPRGGSSAAALVAAAIFVVTVDLAQIFYALSFGS
ncbi:hypothetical protein A4U61_04145 [Streptomyces sp. H-KF8]|nr:hypothetical protein A4U61_04145 [Streptomyces sp. H-KF8]